MEFYKYHSLGNDYLVYDIRKNREELDQEKSSGYAAETLVLVPTVLWQDLMRKRENSLCGYLILTAQRRSREATPSGSLPIISGPQEISRKSLFP